MKNYQLYKTNVLLSGQLKWDVIIGNNKGTLYVKDFHITPVSNYVPYNKYSDDDIINYEHRYNIKDFYQKISGYFYETPVNHYLNGDWPIIADSKHSIPFDNTYLSGCSRMEYKIYNKQFEYLCPVWLEKINNNEHISFKIDLKSNKYKLSSKILYLNIINESGFEFHNKFVNYLNNYLKYTKILSETGCDDIININLDKKEAYLKGVDITTGNIVIRNISNTIDNLLSRERPLMEFDTYITESFKNTNTITPNLINFNICFDIEDILSKNVANRIKGNQIDINIDLGLYNVDFKEFDKTDIYTNYEYIPRDLCNDIYQMDDSYNVISSNTSEINSPNVLDYLSDDKYIEFMNKNKAVQKICHWQLVGNDNYIFNLYDGFGGYINDENGNFLISHRYSTMPDMYQIIYDKKLNNLNWANAFELNEAKYRYILSNYQILINNGYVTCFQNGWVNNIKYNYNGKNLYVILGYINDKNVNIETLADNISSSYVNGCVIHVLGSGNIIFICSDNKSNLTFASISKLCKQTQTFSNIPTGVVSIIPGYDAFKFIPDNNLFIFNNDNLELQSKDSYIDKNKLVITNEQISVNVSNALTSLYEVFSSIIPIPLIIIDNSLYIIKTDSPSLSCDEIEYYKHDGDRNYLIRYDGKIKPCFGYGANYLYYKIYIDNPDIEYINKYSQSGYPPLFKSIKYYSYRKEKIDYDEPSNLIKNNKEYKWYSLNKYIYVPSILNFNVLSIDDQLDNINDEIKNYLKINFNISEQNDEYIDYIFELYDIKYDLISQIEGKFNYKINMCLK